MRIGLHLGPLQEFPPIGELLDFVKRSEDAGIDPILFADSVSLSRFHLHDPYTTLALAAQVTASATIGACVTNPLTRHLSVTANAARVTDYMIDRFGIIGTVPEVTARFESLAAQGVETFLVATPFSLEERIAIVDMLGREVIPRVA